MASAIEQRTNYSAAILAVWEKAAVIAERQQSKIEPIHFLSSIFSLIAHGELSRFGDPDMKVELDEVAKAFDRHGLACGEVLQRLQAGSRDHTISPQGPKHSSGDPISRSDTTKKAFESASLAASQESIAKARLRHLVVGILTHDRDIFAALGIDPAQGKEISADLSHSQSSPSIQNSPRLSGGFPTPSFQKAESTEEVLRTVDANSVLSSKIDWSVVGPKYQEICEMIWNTGACGKVDKLLQSVIEKMLEFIPHATHGAILTVDPKDPKTGELELKAHAPRGDFSPSMSSARQAIDSKEASLWQRHKKRDMSKTQFESNLESGAYAPIIADKECFGVICLNSKTGGHRLTDEDLSLVVTLGHQLGLVFSNQANKDKYTQKNDILQRLMPNFSPQVQKHLVDRAQAGELKLGGQLSEVTILSADIRGFTRMSAEMSTSDVIALLNEYFAVMVECVFRNRGTIDKFIGDAMLVVFNSPEPLPRHFEHAARAALELQQAVQVVSERRRARGARCCAIGIGVHTGEVIHGFIGSADRMEFTIIGDAVNLTSRYCAAALGGEIIISDEVHRKLWHSIQVKATDVGTKHEGNLAAYKLLGFKTN